jgi:mycothiol synthase
MSQLRMEKNDLDSLPDVDVPVGYTLRTFQDGDEAGLGRVYFASALGTETVGQVRSRLHDHPCFAPERVFVALHNDAIVGTASAWQSVLEPDVGYLHMLGVLPQHRGVGLGAALTVAALHFSRDEGFNAQRLRTDDWRVPAIKLYLALGYDPLVADCTHPRRWRKIARKIERPDLIQRARKVAL